MASYQKQLIAALAVGAMAVGSLAYFSRIPAANPGEADNVRVVEDPKLPEQWAVNAAYGRGALSNLRAAFIELENDNSEQARMGVVVARSLLEKIEPARADAVDVTNVGGDLIFVHSEVRVLGDLDNERFVRSKLDAIRRDVDMSDHDAVMAALRALGVPLAYIRIDLPLNETIARIDHVLEALNSNDSERARAMLAQIGDGLRIDTVEIEGHEPPAGSSSGTEAG